MSEIESFSEKRNLARVAAGLKGGTMFSRPNVAPPMNFVEGPAELAAKYDAKMIKQDKPTAPWFGRHTNK